MLQIKMFCVIVDMVMLQLFCKILNSLWIFVNTANCILVSFLKKKEKKSNWLENDFFRELTVKEEEELLHSTDF